ncbi:MAG TPA: hypothetical protein VNX88_14545 [Terriglobales bacterium]|nr:hypothetical protein [Terriglobales bacterium]
MPAPPKDPTAFFAKLDRAEELIFNLRVAWADFAIDTDAYPVEFEDDPGGRTYRLSDALPVPVTMPLIAGDAIHNLRSALDHLAYRLVCVGTNSSGPFDKVYFPIAKLEKDRKAKLKKLETQLSRIAVKELEKIEANEGGSDELLWHLHCLNNIDKHRLLLTVNSQTRMQSMAPSQVRELAKNFLGIASIDSEHSHRAFLTESWKPAFDLNRGDRLAWVSEADVQEHMYFHFELAFGEPAALKGKPVVENLLNIHHRIRGYFMEFDRLGLL